MIKLFEPFQPKIGLCRNTGFLQSLWDKYVPQTSENYGRISLIYLHGGQKDEPKTKQQVELLINLVLKNISVQTNLSQNPMLLNQTAVSRSVKQMRKMYLQQFMRIDFGLYQSLNQYAVHLEQAEREEIRYREWTKENRIITRMQKEYQVLHDLSGRLKELTEWSAGQERRYVKTLFRPYDKKEYKILSEAFLWAEKQQVEEFIRHCSEGQYRNILTRMEKEADIPKAKDGMGAGDAWETVPKERLASLIHSYGQKKFRRFCHQVLSAEIKTDGTYQRLLQAGLFWKKDKKEIYRQLELMEAEEIHRFWEEIPRITEKVCRMQEEFSQEGQAVRRKEFRRDGQAARQEELHEEGQTIRQEELHEETHTIRQKERYRVCRKFLESLEKVRKKYREEAREYVRDTVFRIEDRDEYEIIQNVVDIPSMPETDSVPVYTPLDEVRLFHRDMDAAKAGKTEGQIFADHVQEIQRLLTEQLEVREKRIIQRERQILCQYKDIYKEILSEEEFGKIYRHQLLGADFQIDQPLNQYSVRLEQAEREEIRYREWAKENRLITQMQREYQVLHGLSERLKDLDEVWSAGLERRYGKILFRPFDKKEYKILSEAFLWAEKQQVEKFILQCSEGQYRNILTQMEPELYKLSEEVPMDHVVQTADVSGTEEVPETRDVQKLIPRERFVSLIRSFGQKKFRRFCHQILSVEMKTDETYRELLQAGLFWEKDKKEIYQQFERMKVEEIHRFWEEIPLITAKVCRMQEELHEEGQSIRQENRYRVCRKFSESLEKARKKYRKEIKRYVQDSVLHVENQDEYEIIQNAVDIPAMLETDFVPVYTSLDEIRLSHRDIDAAKAGETEEHIFTHHIQNIRRSLTEQLEIRRQKIVQRERQAAQKDIFMQAAQEDTFIREREEPLRFVKQPVDDVPGAETLERQNVERGNSFAELPGQESIRAESAGEGFGEMQEWGRALLYHPVPKSDAEEEELTVSLQDGTDGLSIEELRTRMIRQQIEAAKQRAELQRVLFQINHRLTDTGFQIEYNKGQLREPSIRKMVSWLGELEGTQYQEAVSQLADTVLMLRVQNQEPEQIQSQSEIYSRQEQARGQPETYSRQEQARGQPETYSGQEQDRRLPETHSGEAYSLTFHDIYPELAHRVRQYIMQREKTRAAESGRMQYFYTDIAEIALRSEGEGIPETGGPEVKQLRFMPARSGYRGRQDITYVFSEEPLSGRKQKNRADARKETMQVKALQQQMDVRLREVEKQLQNRADARQDGNLEDIRSIAEKVKKQLHEELHMERLRRGMV